jgi:hypothetical protein
MSLPPTHPLSVPDDTPENIRAVQGELWDAGFWTGFFWCS